MKIRRLFYVLATFLVGFFGAAGVAAEPVKIGVLSESWGPTPATVGLREGLQALGYRENEQFVLGIRFTQGNSKILPTAARDLLKAGSDILFASGTNPAKAAQAATTSVPVVFAEAVSDPVAAGLVNSVARPGANITGVADLYSELGPKRLEILKEVEPGLRRVIYIYHPDDVGAAEGLRRLREASRQLRVTLAERAVRTDAEARSALAAARKGEDGLIPGGGATMNISGFVLDAMTQQRVPAVFSSAFWADQGAIASYGPDLYESGRQAARLVDKIIKGEKPATIPVETNSRIELVINLKAARALGVVIAPALVQRASRVIE